MQSKHLVVRLQARPSCPIRRECTGENAIRFRRNLITFLTHCFHIILSPNRPLLDVEKPPRGYFNALPAESSATMPASPTPDTPMPATPMPDTPMPDPAAPANPTPGPTVPPSAATPAKAATPSVAAPVPAGSLPAIAIPAKVAAAPSILCFLQGNRFACRRCHPRIRHGRHPRITARHGGRHEYGRGRNDHQSAHVFLPGITVSTVSRKDFL